MNKIQWDNNKDVMKRQKFMLGLAIFGLLLAVFSLGWKLGIVESIQYYEPLLENCSLMWLP